MNELIEAPDVQTGRRLLISVVLVGVLVPIGVMALYAFEHGPGALPRQAVRLALTAILLYFLYVGHRWAKWLNGVLAAIGSIGFIAAAAVVAPKKPAFAVATFVGAIAYGWSAYVVLISRSADVFLLHQQRSRTPTDTSLT